MVAIIQHHKPELFELKREGGTRFCCSDSFVRKYLRNHLKWSERSSTRAGQKTPANAHDLLLESALQEAFLIRDFGIPAELRVNTDQTNSPYAHGAKRTWTKSGEKQVTTVGHEEKRAFTLVPSISASGDVLPMQAIYQGQTQKSCPSSEAPHYSEALALGFQFLPSMTNTYWSTLDTMKQLVDDIIAPYFTRRKHELGLPPDQKSIWRIDCWSVHKSPAFHTWLRTMHPNIFLVFVPAGCTGL
ncbi:hypothetical protein FISHEDRAFT_42295, partial [Fistulina hepatica ATCC 64428]